jgi:hypothetical protein
METLAQNQKSKLTKSDGWVEESVWLAMGRPPYKRTVIRTTAWGAVPYYFLQSRPVETTTKPIFKDRVEKAQWLWQNLPDHIRSYCQLKIYRESRAYRWGHSLANPAQWGWRERAKLAKTPSATIGADPFNGTSTAIGLSAGQVPWAQPPQLEPAQAHAELLFESLQKAKLQIKPKAQKTKAPYKPYVQYPIPERELSEVSMPDFFEKPISPKQTKATPASTPKIKHLQLGIWS